MGLPEMDYTAVVLGLVCRPYRTGVARRVVGVTWIGSLRDLQVQAIIRLAGELCFVGCKHR